MGFSYEHGEGVTRNAKLAFEHYQMGALKGFDMAQNNLGTCYVKGIYVEQSYIKAREWLNRAAAQDNDNAIERLQELDKEEKDKKQKKKRKKRMKKKQKKKYQLHQ